MVRCRHFCWQQPWLSIRRNRPHGQRLGVSTHFGLGEGQVALAHVDVHVKPLFAGYRDVKWLARSHAITVLPSASALVTLRHLPPGSATREKLIGFGDPYFNEQQAAEAEAPSPAETVEVAAADQPGADAVTRGLPLRRRPRLTPRRWTPPSLRCCRGFRTPGRN